MWTAKSLFQAYAPSILVGAHFLSVGGMSNTFLFVLLISILLVAPRGIFGSRRTGRV